jgi:adenylate cyclase
VSSSSVPEAGFAARRRRVQRRRRLRRLWRGRAIFALGFALACGGLALAPATGFLQRISLDALFLARHALFGPLFPLHESDVAVVVIDEETYHTPPFSGRPRVAWTPQIAKVIEAIDAAGPRAIGYDLIDPTSLDQPDLLPRYDRPLLRAFSQAGRAGRLVLGELRLSGEMITPHRGQRIAVGGDDNIRLVNVLVDDDGVVRRQARGFRNEGDGAERLSFVVELARRAGATPPPEDFIINFNTGSSDLPTYALADMLGCAEGNHAAFFARAFKDKIVLIGTALDVEDRHYASTWLLRARPDSSRQARCILPGDPQRFAAIVERRTIPGVFIHAAAINTLSKGLTLRELGRPSHAALVAATALSMALLFFALSPLAGAAVGVAWLTLLLAGTLAAFKAGVVVPGATLVAVAALAFATVYAYRFVVEDRERRRIAHAFRHYLSPDIVERLAADPAALQVGGERRRVTVMFADVVGYTSLTERLADDPERLVAIMNRFLGEASLAIERRAGYVDKFIGDALMAIWGAPLDDPHAERHAVEAALDLRDAMAAINASLGLAEAGLPPLGIRIGLNSGVAIVGNMGGPTRLNYTVAGDVVNLAARFEGANKFYGTAILIGAETASRLDAAFVLRALEEVVVKGRSEPVRLFEVIDRAENVAPVRRERLKAFADAAARYAARDFDAAALAFAALAPDDPCAALFAERAARYAAAPPPPDWTGSLALDSK